MSFERSESGTQFISTLKGKSFLAHLSVTPKELRELCKEKFPHYKIGRNTVGNALSEYVKNGTVHKWDSAKNRMVYGLKEYKKHNRNKCNMCGKPMKLGPEFCRDCEPKALKIVEQCFPCPIPPDYPDRQVED